MENIILNDSIRFSFPDGFRKMSEEELQPVRMDQSGPNVSLRNEDRHVIVSLGHRHAGLLGAFLSDKDLIKNAQSRISSAMQSFGYRLTGYQDRVLAGKTIPSFQYTYTTQGVQMVGECCAMKANKTIYYLHCYVRQSCMEEGIQTWKEILETASFS